MKVRYRAVVALLLLSVLGASFVHYEATEDQRWPYPDADELAADYDTYVGKQAFLFGEVTAVDADGAAFTIKVEATGEIITLSVNGSDADVERGGTVQVYGTLEPDRTVDAQVVRVVNASTGALLYKYGASLVGVLLFLVLFARYWRVDTGRWVLEARRDG
ncbi:hypothetical protein EGH21_20440 [Halomicroarcula sp. F13]|uniref:DNA-binding protein n=1 Tax=Haloarcula rubra TaxID=2487747 RepID=A0AAW4PW36_9EURY|nr:hypothetical protein [Halomicroarcula rubra]MBX0325399.1 hypothetical protein [Halomicroarcula rubra]